jgi:hypothetical protein
MAVGSVRRRDGASDSGAAVGITLTAPDAASMREERRCVCGYGIVAGAPLPSCPMCGASAWAELNRQAGDRREGHA